MEAGVVSTIISTMGAIGIAIVGYHQAKNQKRNDRCEALRQEGALLQLEMIQAAVKLSKVTARAVKGHDTNGDMDKALEWAEKVEIGHADYMRRVTQNV